jgi:hypothetical protein
VTKVYCGIPDSMSRGVRRIADALVRYAPPNVQIVTDDAEADLVIFQVVGVQNFSDESLPQKILIAKQRGQRYAIWHLCVKSTENPDPRFWAEIWQDACCVASYYDLGAYVGANNFWVKSKFLHTPLGVDDQLTVWRPRHCFERIFTIGTSGYIAETEGAAEAAAAVHAVRGYQFHLGPNLGLGPRVMYKHDLTDEQVAQAWNECQYVAGLRRCEGFELVAAEAVLCGARPIMFNAPHYTRWYGDLADYVTESTPDNVAGALASLFRGPYRAVEQAEIDYARTVFHWPTILDKFWKRVVK